MVSIEDSTVIRLRKAENRFEILVDPDKAFEFKRGQKINIEEALAYPSVYKDARKGDVVPREALQVAFGTTDVFKIARKILTEGDFQFTTEQRRTLMHEKTREIADIISKRSINPQTNTPHPPDRILNAMEQTGARVDPFVDANLQVGEIVKSIKPLIPIRIESLVIQLVVPAKFAGKAYSALKQNFENSEEKWLNDGSLQLALTIPAGLETELLQKVGDLTKGDFSSKIIKRMGFDE
ncbi:rRNA metabolism protein [Candidatus Micrarchaeota archaeon RBG_16_49_10]|nr:MAG: rRNA metabolism protein [Candidatus Micrarchaeota archaeon RBG_16_49_10]